jgi:hypothetical protein
MKERLIQNLQKFAKNKKVICEENIKKFFSEIESKKHPTVIVSIIEIYSISMFH